jgi:pleiotropic regulator 1
MQVWDIRTKQPIHVLSGHTNTVNTVVTNSVDPQIISGSSDSTIKVRRISQASKLSRKQSSGRYADSAVERRSS